MADITGYCHKHQEHRWGVSMGFLKKRGGGLTHMIKSVCYSCENEIFERKVIIEKTKCENTEVYYI